MLPLLCAFFFSVVLSQPPVPPGYGLLWSEEFNSNQADWTKTNNMYSGSTSSPRWYAVNDCFACNSNNTYTSHPENVFVANGNLVIQAQHAAQGSKYGYTSANVVSYCGTTTQEWCNGGRDAMNGGSWSGNASLYFDVRAKFPSGPGFWPAIWMLPTGTINPLGWPLGGEIDVMEAVNSENRWTQSTLHYGNTNQACDGQYKFPNGNPDISQAYHSYGMFWDNKVFPYFHFHLDGNIISTTCANGWNGGSVGNAPAPFTINPFYMILNLAVGGSWPGNPPPNTEFPKQMFVDYVRVYQKGHVPSVNKS